MDFGSLLASGSPTNTSGKRVSRSGKSVSSSAATSPLLPRARRMRATRIHSGVSKLKGGLNRERAATEPIGEASILEDLERETLFQFHSSGPQQCSNGFGRSPLAANHLSQIFWVHAELQHGDLGSFDRPHLHVLGMVHEGPGDSFDQLLHRAPPREPLSGRDMRVRPFSGARRDT